MNRIILIGNGFDLAHGLHTKYEDFINWYWKKWIERLGLHQERNISDELCQFKLKINDTWDNFLRNKEDIDIPNSIEFCKWIEENRLSVEFIQSYLLERIVNTIVKNGWVDIETEYYKMLKSCLPRYKGNLYTCYDINRQMQCLKINLIEYLNSLNIGSTVVKNDKIHEIIYSPVNPNDISIEGTSHLVNHFRSWVESGDEKWGYRLAQYNLLKNNLDIQRNSEFCNNFRDDYSAEDIIYFIREGSHPQEILLPDSIMLLDFNYTPTAKLYLASDMDFFHNQIHGTIENIDSVIFGYGDEIESDYGNIEKLDDNEYLRNIKSIKYLESNNYRMMLSFIESAPFQIFIMGHSCGNSDRTLLNTLFEHKNCVSIKPFYYKKNDGTDDYLDIIQNISRNFTDKKLMRDRIVNKTFCEILPQMKRIDNKIIMGKTVTTYLIDGTPKGTQYAFISNKICQMFVVPRSNLSYLSTQEKLQKPAFYILLGEDESTKPQAYIGETENFKERVKDHDSKKVFWQKALIFVSKDADMTKVDVQYLEHKAITEAKKANTFILSDNKQIPKAPNLPEHQQDSMDEFFEDVKFLASFIGCNIFQYFGKFYRNF